MASYNDIKAAAAQVRGEKTTSEGARHLAEIAIALCDRLADLEARHQVDIHRLETWMRNLRR